MRTDPPEVYLAEDEAVLSRLLALRVVAQSRAGELPHEVADAVRLALLEERWADAVQEWIAAGGEPVDAYPDEPVWTANRLDEETASMEIRMAPIFRDR